MPISIEHQLISFVTWYRDFAPIDKLGIDESYFPTPEYKQVFQFLRAHYHDPQTWGSVPSWDLVKLHFPTLTWIHPNDDLPTLCKQLRYQKVRAELLRLASDISMQADQNPEQAVATLRDGNSLISSFTDQSSGMSLSEAHAQLWNEYQQVRSGQGITGIPFPWDVLNEDTQGAHGGEYILLFGRPKSMKTWVGLNVGVHAYRYFNRRVLIFSLEMPPRQVLRRCSALVCMIDYKRFRKGQLNPVDEQKFYDTMQTLGTYESQWREGPHQSALHVFGKNGREGGGINQLQNKIREFRPDLVIVDGQYLMRDDRGKKRDIDWKNQAHISQDIKETAQLFDIPIIGITQATRASRKDTEADLSAVAYSDALAQDCDLAIMVQKRIDKGTQNPEIVLKFPGTREGQLDSFVINGIPAYDFSFKRIVVDEKDEDVPPNQSNGAPMQRPPVTVLPTSRLRGGKTS